MLRYIFLTWSDGVCWRAGAAVTSAESFHCLHYMLCIYYYMQYIYYIQHFYNAIL